MWSAAIQRLSGTFTDIDASTQRVQVNGRIAELEREILELKSFHNALSPVGSLPPEILAKVFIEYRRKHMEEARFKDTSLRWIQITHVCRHWRRIAIECTTLWTELSFANPAVTQLMLQRSKTSPLTVVHVCNLKMTDEAARSTEPLIRALSQMHRIRHLDLQPRGECKATIDNLLPLFSTHSAPFLESFLLKGHGYADTTDLPGGFLKEGTPSLQRLELTNYLISDWSVVVFGPTLKILRLVQFSSQNRPSADSEFFNALKKMTNLETLELDGHLPQCIDGRIYSHLPRRVPVILPALKELELTGEMASIIGFLSVVRLPRASSIELEFDGQVQNPEDIDPVLAALEETLGSTMASGVDGLRICENSNACGPEFIFAFNTGSRLTLSFAMTQLPLGPTITVFKRHMQQFSALRMLQLIDTDMLDKDEWTSLFSTLPNLQVITFRWSQIWDFAAAFEMVPNRSNGLEETASGKPSRCGYPFPKLERILFAQVMMDSDEWLRGTMEDFVRAMARRQDIRPLHKLEIEECSYFYETDRESILEAVPRLELVWDGDENTMSWAELQECYRRQNRLAQH